MAGKGDIKERLRRLLDPAIAVLQKLGMTPLAVTIAGAAISLAGAVLVARGSLRLGGVVLIVAGLCDAMDGSLARRAGTASRFGAFIDSTVDRLAEIASFGALIIYYMGAGEGGEAAVLLVLAALAGAFLTSYTRARAEGLGLECRVGWLERPERMALLVLGLLLGGRALLVIIACIAILANITVIQRIAHVRRLTAAGGGTP